MGFLDHIFNRDGRQQAETRRANQANRARVIQEDANLRANSTPQQRTEQAFRAYVRPGDTENSLETQIYRQYTTPISQGGYGVQAPQPSYVYTPEPLRDALREQGISVNTVDGNAMLFETNNTTILGGETVKIYSDNPYGQGTQFIVNRNGEVRTRNGNSGTFTVPLPSAARAEAERRGIELSQIRGFNGAATLNGTTGNEFTLSNGNAIFVSPTGYLSVRPSGENYFNISDVLAKAGLPTEVSIANIQRDMVWETPEGSHTGIIFTTATGTKVWVSNDQSTALVDLNTSIGYQPPQVIAALLQQARNSQTTLEQAPTVIENIRGVMQDPGEALTNAVSAQDVRTLNGASPALQIVEGMANRPLATVNQGMEYAKETVNEGITNAVDTNIGRNIANQAVQVNARISDEAERVGDAWIENERLRNILTSGPVTAYLEHIIEPFSTEFSGFDYEGYSPEGNNALRIVSATAGHTFREAISFIPLAGLTVGTQGSNQFFTEVMNNGDAPTAEEQEIMDEIITGAVSGDIMNFALNAVANPSIKGATSALVNRFPVLGTPISQLFTSQVDDAAKVLGLQPGMAYSASDLRRAALSALPEGLANKVTAGTASADEIAIFQRVMRARDAITSGLPEGQTYTARGSVARASNPAPASTTSNTSPVTSESALVLQPAAVPVAPTVAPASLAVATADDVIRATGADGALTIGTPSGGSSAVPIWLPETGAPPAAPSSPANPALEMTEVEYLASQAQLQADALRQAQEVTEALGLPPMTAEDLAGIIPAERFLNRVPANSVSPDITMSLSSDGGLADGGLVEANRAWDQVRAKYRYLRESEQMPTHLDEANSISVDDYDRMRAEGHMMIYDVSTGNPFLLSSALPHTVRSANHRTPEIQLRSLGHITPPRNAGEGVRHNGIHQYMEVGGRIIGLSTIQPAPASLPMPTQAQSTQTIQRALTTMQRARTITGSPKVDMDILRDPKYATIHTQLNDPQRLAVYDDQITVSSNHRSISIKLDAEGKPSGVGYYDPSDSRLILDEAPVEELIQWVDDPALAAEALDAIQPLIQELAAASPTLASLPNNPWAPFYTNTWPVAQPVEPIADSTLSSFGLRGSLQTPQHNWQGFPSNTSTPTLRNPNGETLELVHDAANQPVEVRVRNREGNLTARNTEPTTIRQVRDIFTTNLEVPQNNGALEMRTEVYQLFPEVGATPSTLLGTATGYVENINAAHMTWRNPKLTVNRNGDLTGLQVNGSGPGGKNMDLKISLPERDLLNRLIIQVRVPNDTGYEISAQVDPSNNLTNVHVRTIKGPSTASSDTTNPAQLEAVTREVLELIAQVSPPLPAGVEPATTIMDALRQRFPAQTSAPIEPTPAAAASPQVAQVMYHIDMMIPRIDSLTIKRPSEDGWVAHPSHNYAVNIDDEGVVSLAFDAQTNTPGSHLSFSIEAPTSDWSLNDNELVIISRMNGGMGYQFNATLDANNEMTSVTVNPLKQRDLSPFEITDPEQLDKLKDMVLRLIDRVKPLPEGVTPATNIIGALDQHFLPSASAN